SQRSKFGPNTWWYQSCMSFGCSGVGGGLDGQGETGWPTYAIDSDATRNRAMEWMSFTYDMSGELYYEMTMAFFGSDPWTTQRACQAGRAHPARARQGHRDRPTHLHHDRVRHRSGRRGADPGRHALRRLLQRRRAVGLAGDPGARALRAAAAPRRRRSLRGQSP